jgi:hypothetical protein
MRVRAAHPATPSRKPLPLATLNVWPSCTLQVIDDDNCRWKTVGTCLWTPNAIKAAVARLKAEGFPNVWVLMMGERKPMF